MLRKGLRRDILILLAMIADEMNAWSFQNQMRRWKFDGWYKKSNFGPTVSRLLSVGDIEKIEKKGKVFYRLTSRGTERLKQNVSLFKLAQRRWDGRWRIVIFDIQEGSRSLRDALRFKLLSLGFGMWQKSVYITPHNIEQEISQYFESKKLSPSCVCLTARLSDLGDNKALAAKVWRLNELNEEYWGFIEDCGYLMRRAVREGVKEKEIGRLWMSYRDLILADPSLPKELLPENWLAEKARKEFEKLVKSCVKSSRS